MSFEDKVVLITGAASGIGANTAYHLAKLGAKVSIVDVNEKLLNEVADKIAKSGAPKPLRVVADVTTDSERIVLETVEHFGKLNILINNAGVAKSDTIEDVNISTFDRIFDVNVRSVVQLTKLCVPYLETTKGNIVNLSSACSLQTVPNLLSYSMSKAAIKQFTKCTALDLALKRIRVNAIHPGPIQTPILKTLGWSDDEITKMLDDIAAKYPVGRVGEVSDISEAIAFLANDKSASFITGISLPVDGGSVVLGNLH